MPKVVQLRPDLPGGGVPLTTLADSWKLALDGNKATRTIHAYTNSVRTLARWLQANGLPADSEVRAEHVRAFLLAEQQRTSPVSALAHFRYLKVFFAWVASEDERSAPNPMDRIDKPKVTKKAKSFFTDADLAALVKACEGPGFMERRDTAIIRVFMDTGVRVSGLCGLRFDPSNDGLNDVFLSARRLRITLKGGDETFVPIGRAASAALDRYLRARVRRPGAAGSPWLWLGLRGRSVTRLTPQGVGVMLHRRGEQAGIQGVHPHRFRRTFAHNWLKHGGNTEDLMHITGWKTHSMVTEYTEALGLERAHDAHRRLSPGDRI